MAMKESAENSPQQDTQSSCAGGAFTVSAQKKTEQQQQQKKVYDVFMGDEATLPWCTCCKNFQRTKWPCKHFFQVSKYFPGWSFDRLPVQDVTSPFIMLDERILSPIIASSTLPAEDIYLKKPSMHVNQPAYVPLAQEVVENLNPSLDDLTETVNADSKEIRQKKNNAEKSNLLAEQSACRERLQVIRDKTYLVQDTAVLS